MNLETCRLLRNPEFNRRRFAAFDDFSLRAMLVMVIDVGLRREIQKELTRRNIDSYALSIARLN